MIIMPLKNKNKNNSHHQYSDLGDLILKSK